MNDEKDTATPQPVGDDKSKDTSSSPPAVEPSLNESTSVEPVDELPKKPNPETQNLDEPALVKPAAECPTPQASNSEDLIEESMRRLDALLNFMKTETPLPISIPTPISAPTPTPTAVAANSNAQLVSLIQEKFDAMGDKIADRMAKLLSELKYTVGPARAAKIQEINEIAGPEIIDISKLFTEKVASNLEEIGIEEKESKEVDKSLEKLRKLRQGGGL